jgi:DNA-directed RNA polymerase subunit RPC12/RpoP
MWSTKEGRMPIAVTCPKCGKQLKAPDEAAGRTVKCPKCAEGLLIPSHEPVAPPRSPIALDDLDDEHGDEPPRSEPRNRAERVYTDRESSGDQSPPSRPRRTSSPGIALVLSIVGLASWGLLLIVILVGGLLFVTSLGKADTAIQEAALGAVFSTVFIGLYIAVRCIEKILIAVDRLQSKPTNESR